MKKFLDEDFLLKSETAKILYHEYAEKCQFMIIIVT